MMKLNKAVKLFAQVLEVEQAEIFVVSSSKDYAYLEYYSNGQFIIYIPKEYKKRARLQALAHEMVHVRQYFTGQLRNCDKYFYWSDVRYELPKHMSDAYFMAPWEYEARAMEALLLNKWDER